MEQEYSTLQDGLLFAFEGSRRSRTCSQHHRFPSRCEFALASFLNPHWSTQSLGTSRREPGAIQGRPLIRSPSAYLLQVEQLPTQGLVSLWQAWLAPFPFSVTLTGVAAVAAGGRARASTVASHFDVVKLLMGLVIGKEECMVCFLCEQLDVVESSMSREGEG